MGFWYVGCQTKTVDAKSSSGYHQNSHFVYNCNNFYDKTGIHSLKDKSHKSSPQQTTTYIVEKVPTASWLQSSQTPDSWVHHCHPLTSATYKNNNNNFIIPVNSDRLIFCLFDIVNNWYPTESGVVCSLVGANFVISFL